MSEDVDFEFVVGSLGFGAGFLEGIGGGKDDAHAAMSFHLGFAKDAHVGAGLGEHLLETVKLYLVGVAFNHNGARGRGPEETYSGHGQA